jgi:DHA2 family multidrug resistance protein
VVLLPLWLQQYMGYTATEAGMALAPVGVLAILLTPIVGQERRRNGIRAGWPPGAFILFAVVLWMRALLHVGGRLRTILVVPTFIQGGAMAFFFIPLTS